MMRYRVGDQFHLFKPGDEHDELGTIVRIAGDAIEVQWESSTDPHTYLAGDLRNFRLRVPRLDSPKAVIDWITRGWGDSSDRPEAP